LTLRVNQSACQDVGQRQLSPRSAASSHLDCRAVLILIVALYAITVFDSYDDILDKACDAWTFFANDQNRIASITTRSWATVIL
jgi:hypothetical protein